MNVAAKLGPFSYRGSKSLLKLHFDTFLLLRGRYSYLCSTKLTFLITLHTIAPKDKAVKKLIKHDRRKRERTFTFVIPKLRSPVPVNQVIKQQSRYSRNCDAHATFDRATDRRPRGLKCGTIRSAVPTRANKRDPRSSKECNDTFRNEITAMRAPPRT